MKKLIIGLAAMLASASCLADSVLDNNYICEDGKVLTVNAAGITVDGELHRYVGQTQSSGLRGDRYISTVASEYDDQWFFITGRDVGTGLLVHEDDNWFCESSWSQK